MIAIEKRSHTFALSEKTLSDYLNHYEHLGIFDSKESGQEKQNKNLLAFVVYQKVIDEAEIIHLVCDAKVQGKGIAYQLMQTLIQQEKNITTWHLEVREHNLSAIKLYEKLGFKLVGRRKNYYKNNDDALLMALVL